MTASPVSDVTVIDGPPVPRESNSDLRPPPRADTRHATAEHLERTGSGILQPEAGLGQLNDPAVAGARGEGHVASSDPREHDAAATRVNDRVGVDS